MSPQMTRRGAGALPLGSPPSASHAVACATCAVIAGVVLKFAGIGQARLPIIATTPIMLMRTSTRPSSTGMPRKN